MNQKPNRGSNSRPKRALRACVLTTLCVALGSTWTLSARAEASDSVVAQALFDDGKRLMAAGKMAEACPKFEESQKRDPGTGTLLNLAACYEASDRLASAWSTYLEAVFSAHAAGHADREAMAREHARALEPRLSKLVIRVAPEARVTGLEIKRDGANVGAAEWGLPIPANTGRHTVTAAAPGHRPWQTNVTVTGEGTSSEVTVPVLGAAPNAPEASKPGASSGGLGTQRILALVAGGIGVVGVGLGTYFTFQSKASHDETDRLCNHSPSCPTQAGVDASNDAQREGNLATIGMIVGAVGLSGGLALWLTAPSSPGDPSTRVGFGPGTVHVRGAW